MKDWGAPARLADDGANGVSFAGGGGGGEKMSLRRSWQRRPEALYRREPD